MKAWIAASICLLGAACVLARYPSKSCYNCAYSPPRNYTATKLLWKEVDGEWVQEAVTVTKMSQGGWDKCMGNFTQEDAAANGVDLWACHSNCYVREAADGSLFRGCYKGEYGVDPNMLGCHIQAGQAWCFCEEDKCNIHMY